MLVTPARSLLFGLAAFTWAVAAAGAPARPLPIWFEPVSPAATEVVARAPHYTAIVRAASMDLYSLPGHAPLQLHFVGAAPTATLQPEQRLPSVSRYYHGSPSQRWRSAVPHYAQARVTALYPGVDAIYYAGPGGMEFDIVLRPGASPAPIAFQYSGHSALRLDEAGDLIVTIAGQEMRQKRPRAFQAGRPVPSRYHLQTNGLVRFELGEYDHQQPLTIDPELLYSAVAGAAAADRGNALIVDAAGNAFVAGETAASFGPANPLPTYAGGPSDAYIAKFRPDGNLEFVTFLGGSGADRAKAIGLDKDGGIHVAGGAGAAFPLLSATQTTFGGGGSDGFLAKLNANGTLAYSSYIGGAGADAVGSLALGMQSGKIYLTGETASGLGPYCTGQSISAGSRPAFVVQLTAQGAPGLCRYLGDAGTHSGLDIAVDPFGTIFVSGVTNGGFAATAGSIRTSFQGGATDGFLAILNPDGASLYSTYLGTGGTDSADAIALGADGSVYVAGTAGGSGFPTRNAAQPSPAGQGDAFLIKLSPSRSIVFATYWGGPSADAAKSVALDAAGGILIGGSTAGTLPVLQPAQPAPGGGVDGFVAKFDSLGRLVYGSYLGGVGNDEVLAVVAMANGEGYATGFTTSANFPRTLGILPSGTQTDSFLSRLTPGGWPATTRIHSVSPDSFIVGGSTEILTIELENAEPDTQIFWNGTLLERPVSITLVRPEPGASRNATTRVVPAGLLQIAGPASITAANPGQMQSAAALVNVLGAEPAPVLLSASHDYTITEPGGAVSDRYLLVRGFNILPGATVQLNGVALPTFARTFADRVSSDDRGAGLWALLSPSTPLPNGANQIQIANSPARRSIVGTLNVDRRTLTSLSPNPTPAAADVVTTLAGAGFDAALDRVRVGTGFGQNLNFTSASSLSARLPGAAIPVAGTYSVWVETQSPGFGPGSLQRVPSNQLTLTATVPACASLSLSNETIPVDTGRSAQSVAVFVGGLCSWTVVGDRSWVQITSGAGGSGNGIVQFTVQANPLGIERTATLNIAGKTALIVQRGCPPSPSFGRSTQVLPSAGGQLEFTAFGAEGCSSLQTLTSEAPWANGFVNFAGRVQMTAEESTEATNRGVRLGIGGRPFLITQLASASPQACTVSTSFPPVTIAREGLTEAVNSISIACQNIPAGATIDLDLFVPGTVISNRTVNGLANALLTIGNQAPLSAQPMGAGGVRWTQVPLPTGSSSLQISNVRIDATRIADGTAVFADLGVTSRLPLPLNNSRPQVAFVTSGIATPAPVLSAPLSGVQRGLTVQFNELFSGALRAARAGATATRAVVRLQGIPPNAKVYAPISPNQGSSLARLLSANEFGAGGSPVVPLTINGRAYGEIQPALPGVYVATWEILVESSAPNRTVLTFPLLLEQITTSAMQTVLASARSFPGPASGVVGPSPDAAVPRYASNDLLPPQASYRLGSTVVERPPVTVNSTEKRTGRALFATGRDLTLVQEVATGDTGLTQTVVRNNLPAGLTLLNCSVPCTSSNGQVEANLGDLGPQQVTSFEVNLRVGPEFAQGGISNTWTSLSARERPTNSDLTYTDNAFETKACRYTATPTTSPRNVPATASTLEFAITADAPDCPWFVGASANWLTPTPLQSAGTATVRVSIAANPGPARSATLSLPGLSITINQAAGVAPCSYALGGTALAVPHTAGSSNMALTTAAGCAWTASAASAGNWLGVSPLASSGSGALVITYAENPTGLARQGTILAGGVTLTVTQAAAPPQVNDTSPIASAGATQTFVFRFSHVSDFNQLGVLNVLINQALDGGNACYLAYSHPVQTLFLVKDAGPAAGLDGITLGGTSSVQNSQCRISSAGSSAVGSGRILTLTVNITFLAGFTGNRVIYLAARDRNEVNSGWFTKGFHSVPGGSVPFPQSIGMSPSTGSAATATASFVFEDQTSANNVRTAWALINTAVDASRACYVAYYAPDNLLFLLPDDGNGANVTVMPLSGSGILENSQCRVSAQGSSAVKAGARLTVNLNLTFKPSFAGAKGVWLALQTLSSVTSPWTISGAWQVPP